MGEMKFEDKDKKGLTSKIGMYISLGLCMLALGAGAWSAVNQVNSLTDSEAKQVTTITSEKNVKQAEQKITNVTVEQTTNKKAESTKEPKTTAEEAISPVAEFFTMPVGGAITKDYSDKELQYSETYNDWRAHLGVDIAADKGTEVYAAGNGKVIKVYEDELLGNTVVIDHGNGIVAYYSGLNSSLVKVNQVVEAGTTIGGIGDISSEIVEEAHLHFAVKKDDKWVSPIETLEIVIL